MVKKRSVELTTIYHETKLRSSMLGNLSSGSIFPQITIKTVNFGELVLPGDLESKYGMILFYRGGW